LSTIVTGFAEVILDPTKSNEGKVNETSRVNKFTKRKRFPMFIVEENGSDQKEFLANSPATSQMKNVTAGSPNGTQTHQNLTYLTSYELELQSSNETDLLKNILGNDTSKWIYNSSALKPGGKNVKSFDHAPLHHHEGNIIAGLLAEFNYVIHTQE
jgi:hypothetical protein